MLLRTVAVVVKNSYSVPVCLNFSPLFSRSMFYATPATVHMMSLAAQQPSAGARLGDSLRVLALRDWGNVFLVGHCHHSHSGHGLAEVHLPYPQPCFSGWKAKRKTAFCALPVFVRAEVVSIFQHLMWLCHCRLFCPASSPMHIYIRTWWWGCFGSCPTSRKPPLS